MKLTSIWVFFIYPRWYCIRFGEKMLLLCLKALLEARPFALCFYFLAAMKWVALLCHTLPTKLFCLTTDLLILCGLICLQWSFRYLVSFFSNSALTIDFLIFYKRITYLSLPGVSRIMILGSENPRANSKGIILNIGARVISCHSVLWAFLLRVQCY